MTPLLTDFPMLPAPEVAAGPRHVHEWARYQLGDLTRVLCTQFTDGETVLCDIPANELEGEPGAAGADDSYLVEPHLSNNNAELEALVADYLQQVALHQCVPMSVPLLD